MFRRHGEAGRKRKGFPDQLHFDPETQEAVIRSSVCTGEKVAGILDRRDGHFTEVMLIRTPEDEKQFREFCHQETVRVIY